MYHGLADVRSDCISDGIDEVVVAYLSIAIESVNIVHVFLDTICLFDIPDLVQSPVCLIVVTIVLPCGIPDLFPSIKPMLIRCLPFQRISFCI